MRGPFQGPGIWSVQIPYYKAHVTAFSQTSFLLDRFYVTIFCENFIFGLCHSLIQVRFYTIPHGRGPSATTKKLRSSGDERKMSYLSFIGVR